MVSKDNKPSGSKDTLLKDLKSLRNTLDEDDDNVPLLLGDDDIPVLTGDDDDIPVLDHADAFDDHAATNKASLEAALRQLESMELAPKSRKAPAAASLGIEDTIRANAAAPIISNEELTRVRENPFLNSNQKAQLDASRKLREEAQHKTAAPKKNEAPSPAMGGGEAIDFTDNPFLKASTSPVGTASSAAPVVATMAAEEEDGSAAILKELEEEAKPATRKVPDKKQDIDKELADIDRELDGLGDIILDDKKLPDKEIDLVVNEIVDEYMVILEAALRKKLKEKLPHLLK